MRRTAGEFTRDTDPPPRCIAGTAADRTLIFFSRVTRRAPRYPLITAPCLFSSQATDSPLRSLRMLARRFAALGLTACLVVPALAADPDLSGYRTIDKAVVAAPGRFKGAEITSAPAFLGLSLAADAKARLI